MIDNATILISLGLVLFVVVRSVRLDRGVPWFGVPRPPTILDDAPDAAEPRRPAVVPWRERGTSAAAPRQRIR